MPNVSFQSFAPGFVSRFLESHAVMLQGNAGLKPKEGEYTSRPWEWPINLRVTLVLRFYFIFRAIILFLTLFVKKQKSNILYDKCQFREQGGDYADLNSAWLCSPIFFLTSSSISAVFFLASPAFLSKSLKAESAASPSGAGAAAAGAGAAAAAGAAAGAGSAASST